MNFDLKLEKKSKTVLDEDGRWLSLSTSSLQETFLLKFEIVYLYPIEWGAWNHMKDMSDKRAKNQKSLDLKFENVCNKKL